MVEFFNIINSVADSNLAYYVLVIVLLIVVITMIYLIFSQNKEIKEKKMSREEELMKYISSTNEEDVVEELAQDIQEKKEEEIFHTVESPIRDSILEIKDQDIVETKDDVVFEKPNIISKDSLLDVNEDEESELDEEIDEMIHPESELDEEIDETIHSESDESRTDILNMILDDKLDEVNDIVSDNSNVNEVSKKLEVEKVKAVQDIELPRIKKMELIDATLTNLPKVSLLEETMTAIPPVLEYSNETEELMSITRELEKLPKDKTIKLTPYEEEQEQSAIISYDELVNKNDGVVYDEVKKEDGLSIKKVDLEKTSEINIDDIKLHLPKEKYAHEELFLKKLKSLQSKIN